MTEVSYAPDPSYSPEDYQRAKASLADPNLPEKSRAMRAARIAEFEKSQAFDQQAQGHHEYQASAQLDPVKEELVKKARQATRDDTLNSASQLKVYGGQAEFEPPVKANPFSAMSPFAAPEKHIWQEPTVKDFRAALSSNGALAEKAKRELGAGAFGDDSPPVAPGSNEHASPRVKDITQLGNKPTDPSNYDDSQLEGTEAFKVYRDAAWQHALADSIAKGKPIYRAAFTSKLSPEEKKLASVSDVGGAVLGGAGQSASLGLLDPIKRSINPDLAASDRQQRNRHPTAEMAGEIGGAVVGAPEAIARGSAKLLGGKLGNTALGRLGASVGAGAITGGADAQIRAIAQSAADALDARDSVEEMTHKLYDALSLGTTLGGAGMGAGAGLVGHAIGSAAGGIGKKIVTSGEGESGRAVTVKQNLDTGGKMDWKGQIKTEPEIENLVHEAPHDMPADEVLARKAADPMLKQRRLEQESAHREADAVTAKARERLGGQTVPVEDTADRLEKYAAGLVDDTASSEVRKLARKLRKASLLSPEELDQYIESMDQKAGYDSGKKLDKKRQHFVEAGRILREDRDSLRFDEPTNAGGFALRDSRGNVSSNTDYSAMKTELSGKQHALNEENKLLGLPEEIPVAPQRLGAPDPGPPNPASPLEVLPKPSKQQLEAHRQAMAQNSANVTPEEVEAVRRFTHGYDESLRGLQRGKTAEEIASGNKRGADHAREAAESLPHLESYMKKMPPATEIPYVYRGIVVSKEEAQNLLRARELHADPVGQTAVTSVSADPVVARSFVARNLNDGQTGIVLKIKHRSAVGTGDHASPQMRVEKELLLPGNAKLRVTKRYNDTSTPGQIIIEAEEVAPGAMDDSARNALAEGTEPNVQLPLDKEKEFLRGLQNAGNPGRSAETLAQERLAERSGVSKEYDFIKKLRARKDYRSMLGKAMHGVTLGPGGMGNKYFSTDQFLRLVPTLRSLSGGLPKMEATDKLVNILDRHIAEHATPGAGRSAAGERVMGSMVPEAKALNLRGGQPAKFTGAATRKEKGDSAKLSPEETALAKALIKRLQEQEQ